MRRRGLDQEGGKWNSRVTEEKHCALDRSAKGAWRQSSLLDFELSAVNVTISNHLDGILRS